MPVITVPPEEWFITKLASVKEANAELTDSQAAAEVSKIWYEQLSDIDRSFVVAKRDASTRITADLDMVAAEFRNLFSTNYAKWIQMEVKLLAMNNFGKWESMSDANEKINDASVEITRMLQKAVKSEVIRLIEEVRYDILDEMSASVKEEQVGLSSPEGGPGAGPEHAPVTPPPPAAPQASKNFEINLSAEDHKILDALCDGDGDLLRGLVNKTAGNVMAQASVEELTAASEALEALLAEVKPGKLQERTASLKQFVDSKLEVTAADSDPLPDDVENSTLEVLKALSFFLKNGDPSLKAEMQKSFDAASKKLEELRKQKAEWLKKNEFKGEEGADNGSN